MGAVAEADPAMILKVTRSFDAQALRLADEGDFGRHTALKDTLGLTAMFLRTFFTVEKRCYPSNVLLTARSASP